MTTLTEYAADCLAILRASLEQVAGGNPPFYRVAAVQLRLLLCDTTRRHDRVVETSLLPQVRPDLRLPPLGADGAFHPELPPLPLADWLAQPLPGGKLTLRQLIRRVCDTDGGAHVDPRRRAGLAGVSDPAGWIVRIGRVVADAIILI